MSKTMMLVGLVVLLMVAAYYLTPHPGAGDVISGKSCYESGETLPEWGVCCEGLATETKTLFNTNTGQETIYMKCVPIPEK